VACCDVLVVEASEGQCIGNELVHALQVSSEEGRRVADDIGAAAYCECSALTSDGVRDMFETCVRLTCQHRPTTSRSRARAGSRKHVCVQQ